MNVGTWGALVHGRINSQSQRESWPSALQVSLPRPSDLPSSCLGQVDRCRSQHSRSIALISNSVARKPESAAALLLHAERAYKGESVMNVLLAWDDCLPQNTGFSSLSGNHPPICGESQSLVPEPQPGIPGECLASSARAEKKGHTIARA